MDWDVHHGNGTSDLFYDDDSVLMIDMHEDGVWPGSGLLNETGTGRGQGHTINIPMPSQTMLIVDVSHKTLPKSAARTTHVHVCHVSACELI